jgi:hypothetical protein
MPNITPVLAIDGKRAGLGTGGPGRNGPRPAPRSDGTIRFPKALAYGKSKVPARHPDRLHAPRRFQ